MSKHGKNHAEEECAQVGDPNYAELARKQCERYIARIRDVCGMEPPGARLRTLWQPHDLGNYVEVVCTFEVEDEAATEYAYRCENDGPTTWEDD